MDVLYFNGRITSTDEPVLTVEDRGFQFGDSLYEVIKFVAGAPRFAKPHWRRLEDGLTFLEIPSPWPEFSGFVRAVGEVLDRTEFADGILYIQITRGAAERSHVPRSKLTPTTVIYSRQMQFPDAERKRAGVPVITHEDARWKYCSVKSVNLLPNTMAKRAAVAAGAAEAILFDGEIVTEGSQSNFFLVQDGRVVTHPADDRILPGIVRDQVLRLAREHGIVIEERPIRRSELTSGEEAFLTSTTQAVMPITAIDAAAVGTGTAGPVTLRLQALFDELEHSERAIDRV